MKRPRLKVCLAAVVVFLVSALFGTGIVWVIASMTGIPFDSWMRAFGFILVCIPLARLVGWSFKYLLENW